MADTIVHTGVPEAAHIAGESPRRDFLKLVTGATAIVGIGAVIWPFVDFLNPSADVLALSSTEVSLTPIPEGQGITVVWRGKPIFVRHLTPGELETALNVPLSALPDPQPVDVRVKPGHDQWIVLVGICTHLGCVPLGNKPTDPRGNWGGWFCPCHGSQYDTVGRVRHGPAPLNLFIPPYEYLSNTQIRIGTGPQKCDITGCREAVGTGA
jgi:ubiquinol-cytochrome c reductase iron-sulfur subunit